MNQVEYATHRGISKQAVNKAVKAGKLAGAVGSDGRIDRDKADELWKNGQSRMSSPGQLAGVRTTPAADPAAPPVDGAPPAAAPTGTYAQAHAVREAYLARTAKLEYEERIGKLVSADEVKAITFAQHRRVRDLLLTLPDRVAPLLPLESDGRIAARLLLVTEVNRALAELRSEFAGGAGAAGSGSA